MRKRRVLIIAACLVACLVAAALLHQHPQPTYQGRTLHQWLQAFSPPYPDGDDAPQKAREAVRHIGTNAIPALLQWISYDPPPYQRAIEDLLFRLPDSIRPDALGGARTKATLALNGFSILGPMASPAAPELARLTVTARANARAIACITALSLIGPNATPSMITVLTNQHCESRWYAMQLIAPGAANTQAVLPVLLAALDGADRPACAAAMALGRLKLSPETAVPALTASLERPDCSYPEVTGAALAEFDPQAAFVAPRLLLLTTNASEATRTGAQLALSRIAPEMLTNTPPR